MFEFNPDEWLPADYDQKRGLGKDNKSVNNETEPKKNDCNNETATPEDIERLVQRIESAMADIAPTYAQWRDLGFALCEALGESGRDYYHRLSRLHSGYSAADTDKQYNRCLKSHGGGVTVKTLFFLAKESGIKLKETQTNENDIDKLTNCQIDKEDNIGNLPENEEEKSPTFPKEIYDNLPGILSKVVSMARGEDDADLLLLGSLTTLSSCLPNIYGNYDERRVYPNLFLFVTAQASAGKGRLTLCHRLVEPIHRNLRALWRKQMEVYEKQLSAFVASKDKKDGERPQEPPLLSLFIPANSSATAVFQMLNDNKGVGLMFETEGDTLAQTFKTEHGNYSDGFRKAFHHETISYNRRKDREFVELETPRMSAVLSGTPRQIKSLVPDTENGLFSRFMFYYMNVRLVWKDVFASADGEPADEFFSDLGQEYFSLYRALEEQNRWLRFSLQPSQQQQFNNYFEGIQKEYTEMLGLDILASVRRLGLITYRIAMILTALRLQETGNFSDVLVCDDRDFKTALSISKVLIKHTEKVYKTLEVSDSTNMKKHIQTQKKLMKSIFFEKLPVTFSRKDYITIAADLGIHERTSTRYVNEFILLERICKIGHGTFKKT